MSYKRKLQEINTQLLKLEDSKKLCETKIREICPHIPSPFNPLRKQIESLKYEFSARKEENNIISKKPSIDSEYDKYSKEETSHLKETIMILSKTVDSYKNYIQILKETINAKIDSWDLKGAFEKFCQKKRDNVDTFAEFIMLQGKIDELQKLDNNAPNNEVANEVKNLHAKIMEYETIAKKQEEAIKLFQNKYKDTASKLTTLQNEIQQQIDITHQKDEEIKRFSNVSAQHSEIGYLKEALLSATKKVDALQNDIQNKGKLHTAQVCLLRADNKSKEDLIKELKLAIALQKSKNGDYNETSLLHLKETTTTYQNENIELYQNNTNLRNQNLLLKNEILTLTEQNESLLDQIKQQELKIKALESSQSDILEIDTVYYYIGKE